MPAECVLPAGTDRVPVLDIPVLLATAMYPELPEDTPRQIVRLTKVATTEVNIKNWGGIDIPLADEDLVKLTRECWGHLPALQLPIDEPSWQPYWEAAQSKRQRGWKLSVGKSNPHSNAQLMRIATGEAYEKTVIDDVMTGGLVPRSNITGLQMAGAVGDMLNYCYVTVAELVPYAKARFDIGVRVAESPNALTHPTKPTQLRRLQAPEPLHTLPCQVGTPNWNEWKLMPSVRVFEACALSVGIDPHSMTTTGNDWMVGYPTLLTYANKCFPNKATADEFHSRQRVLWANLPNNNYFPSAVIHANNPSVSTTSLQEFAVWALSVAKWKDLPAELVAMAKAPDKNSDPAPSTSGRITIEKLVWEIAQAKAAEHPENWNHEDGDPMNKTVVAAINKHGWEPDGIPGLLPLIIAMADTKEISPKSTFNDCPPTTTALIHTNPANWYLSEADSQVVRMRFPSVGEQQLTTTAPAESKPPIEVVTPLTEFNSIESADTDNAPTQSSAVSPICAFFRDMANLKPNEVSIDFAAGESGSVILNISARAQSRRVALAEIDLFDRRKAQMNEQCVLLLGMAKGEQVKNSDNAKSKQISRIRGIFKKHFGVGDDPFSPYQTATGYSPLFKITDSRGSADERAKRDGERRTVPLNEAVDYANEDDVAGQWLKNKVREG